MIPVPVYCRALYHIQQKKQNKNWSLIVRRAYINLHNPVPHTPARQNTPGASLTDVSFCLFSQSLKRFGLLSVQLALVWTVQQYDETNTPFHDTHRVMCMMLLLLIAHRLREVIVFVWAVIGWLPQCSGNAHLLSLPERRCPLCGAAHLVPKHVLGRTIIQIWGNSLIHSLAVKPPPPTVPKCVCLAVRPLIMSRKYSGLLFTNSITYDSIKPILLTLFLMHFPGNIVNNSSVHIIIKKKNAHDPINNNYFPNVFKPQPNLFRNFNQANLFLKLVDTHF